ncbi:MAG: hypothetical protein AABZ65_00080 [Candidatus Omnitrophota bacterium]
MSASDAAKQELALKLSQLEEFKKKLPSYKDRQCGVIKHNDSVELWEKIEELEAEIEDLKHKEDK